MGNQRFSITPAKAVGDQNMPDGVFRTLAALGLYGDKNGWCWPSRKTLAEIRGVSKTAITKHIYWLKKHNYLNIQKRIDTSGAQRSNLYQMRFDFPLEVSEVSGGVTSEVTPPVTPEVTHTVTPGVTHNAPMNASLKRGGEAEKAPLPAPDFDDLQSASDSLPPLKQKGGSVPLQNLRGPELDAAILLRAGRTKEELGGDPAIAAAERRLQQAGVTIRVVRYRKAVVYLLAATGWGAPTSGELRLWLARGKEPPQIPGQVEEFGLSNLYRLYKQAWLTLKDLGSVSHPGAFTRTMRGLLRSGAQSSSGPVLTPEQRAAQRKFMAEEAKR